MSADECRWFCANPGCDLHVDLDGDGVVGSGEWAERADGVIRSRVRVGEQLLCDRCAVSRVESAAMSETTGQNEGAQ